MNQLLVIKNKHHGMNHFQATGKAGRVATLPPRAEQPSCHAPDGELIGTSAEVARVDLSRAKVLNAVEARPFPGDLRGRKEELEGLSRELDP